LGQRTGIFVEMILPLLEALLPLLLLFATDFLGRGIERYAKTRTDCTQSPPSLWAGARAL
jgi:hypothetical protein